MPHNFFTFLLLSYLSVIGYVQFSIGYGLALGLVIALSVGSVMIWVYPRIELSIDCQESLFICVLYYIRSMQNYYKSCFPIRQYFQIELVLQA